MQKDAKTEAAKDNVKLTVAAGKSDGDTQTQISAIDNAISRGDKGILITTNGDAVNTELKKAQAGRAVRHRAGHRADAAEHRRHHLRHGQRAGRQADRPVRRDQARRRQGRDRDARPVQQPGRLGRHQRATTASSRAWASTPAARPRTARRPSPATTPAARAATTRSPATSRRRARSPAARPRWRTACRRTATSTSSTRSTSPRPTARYQALKAAGKTNVIVVTIDGSCKYVNGLLKHGTIAADSAQYPGKMASKGVKTIADLARGGAQADPAGRQGLHRHRHRARDREPDHRASTARPRTRPPAQCWGS